MPQARIIIVYDPSGHFPMPLPNATNVMNLKVARLDLASDLEPATIAGIATQLGMMLLEQIAPPKPKPQE